MRRSPLGDRVVAFLISDVVESLAVEFVESDAVGLVSDEEIEDAQTRVRQLSSPGKRPMTFAQKFNFAE